MDTLRTSHHICYINIMANYKTLDSWSIKAQKEGYPARSVYKLQEIGEKFSLFHTLQGKKAQVNEGAAFKVLDLGCAPGSWSVYVLRKLKNNVFLAACDLSDLTNDSVKADFANSKAFFLKGDMEDAQNHAILCSKGPYNLVLCDAAPSTTGNRNIDTARSISLAEMSLHYAETALVKGGAWVTKIFQGSNTSDFLKTAAAKFKKFQTFKPKACRTNSFEIYAIGLGKI
ncbi:ribosomal RNA large subunit methyltransferase E [Spirochaetia bacterium]|nr:ribosomal RNA large subunit methyltransferase E [Spirochaetia bacterium]